MKIRILKPLYQPGLCGELSNILFEDYKIDNYENDYAYKNIIINRNKRMQQQALKENDLQRLNELIIEGRRLGAND